MLTLVRRIPGAFNARQKVISTKQRLADRRKYIHVMLYKQNESIYPLEHHPLEYALGAVTGIVMLSHVASTLEKEQEPRKRKLVFGRADKTSDQGPQLIPGWASSLQVVGRMM